MAMFSLFRDGPEYIQRTKTPFSPTKVRYLLMDGLIAYVPAGR